MEKSVREERVQKVVDVASEAYKKFTWEESMQKGMAALGWIGDRAERRAIYGEAAKIFNARSQASKETRRKETETAKIAGPQYDLF